MFVGSRNLRSRRLAIASSFTLLALATLSLSVSSSYGAETDPRLTVKQLGPDLVIVNARYLPEATTATVTATVDGGQGQSQISTGSSGRVLLGFQTPEDFTGEVEVVLSVGDIELQQSIALSREVENVVTTSTSAAPSTSTTLVQQAPTGTLPENIKLLPLGDSITDDSGGAYRASLFDQLTAKTSHTWDFVGTRRDPEFSAAKDRDQEGHSGWTNGQLAEIATDVVSRTQPDVVTLHSGTNDLNGGATGQQAAAELRKLLDAIYAGKGDTHVIVAGIIPPYTPSVIGYADYTALVPQVVNEYKASGKSISYVDMSKIVNRSDYYDDLHPADSGKAKMADAWYGAVTNWIGAR